MSNKLRTINHARWMSSAIYILKMLICKNFFKHDEQTGQDIATMSPFVICIYFLYWFQCHKLADAPALTLELYQDLQKWTTIDEQGGKAALKKLDLHTDYLNGRSVVMAFASTKVDAKTKEAMANALMAIEPISLETGKPDIPRVYLDSSLECYIDEESWQFFKLSHIEPTFLNKPCSSWHSDESYKKFCHVVNGLTPINDAGERAVKFSGDYDKQCTSHEKRQSMLQTIDEHKTLRSSATKLSY